MIFRYHFNITQINQLNITIEYHLQLNQNPINYRTQHSDDLYENILFFTTL